MEFELKIYVSMDNKICIIIALFSESTDIDNTTRQRDHTGCTVHLHNRDATQFIFAKCSHFPAKQHVIFWIWVSPCSSSRRHPLFSQTLSHISERKPLKFMSNSTPLTNCPFRFRYTIVTTSLQCNSIRCPYDLENLESRMTTKLTHDILSKVEKLRISLSSIIPLKAYGDMNSMSSRISLWLSRWKSLSYIPLFNWPYVSLRALKSLRRHVLIIIIFSDNRHYHNDTESVRNDHVTWRHQNPDRSGIWTVNTDSWCQNHRFVGRSTMIHMYSFKVCRSSSGWNYFITTTIDNWRILQTHISSVNHVYDTRYVVSLRRIHSKQKSKITVKDWSYNPLLDFDNSSITRDSSTSTPRMTETDSNETSVIIIPRWRNVPQQTPYSFTISEHYHFHD